jgi:acyl-CoA-binding protein
MTIEEQFEQAVKRSKELPERPSDNDLLKIYALFKQAKEGDVAGERPGGFDFVAAAKYNAWEKLKGKSKQEAMNDYVALIDCLESK